METKYEITSSQFEALNKINQKRYIQGEIAYLIDKEKYVMWDGEKWIDIPKVEETVDNNSSGLKLSLYDLNKSIMAQFPIIEDFTEAKDIIYNFFLNNGESYMLLCKDISYYTIFQKRDFAEFETLEDAVLTCANDIGKIVSVHLNEENNGIEIWVRTPDNDNMCMYLFDCEGLIVSFGG